MFKGSWRTTALGVLSLLTIIGQQGSNMLDSDPATHFSWEIVGPALTAFALLFTRDNSVTSEAAGASRM
jgi:hypothetical protein